MEDFIFAPVVLLVGFGIHAAVLRQHSVDEGRLLTMSFFMHVAAGVGQVLLTRYYFKGGDMIGYWETGVPMADAMRSDFGLFAPAIVQAFFRVEDISAPIELMPGGGSTASMSAVAIWLLFLVGNSLYAAVLVVAVAAYVSKVLIYRALKPEVPAAHHRALQIGATMLPTAVFWSSGLLKEPVVICMIGPLLLGLRWLLARQRRAQAIVLVVVGATVISVIKPYVLMALSIAAAVFYLWSRLLSRDNAALKPFAVIIASAIGFGGFLLGNRYFVKAENEDAMASFSRQRQVGYAAEGGSNFSIEMGGPQDPEQTNRSIAYELALAPLAIFTALFRPLLFEARNVVQLANAIEATALFILFYQVVRRRSLRGVFDMIRGSPTLLFCAVFTLALALGTGLATTNMGTLSRYRAPMMPFFFILLMLLRADSKSQVSPAGAGRSPGPVPRARVGVPEPQP